MISSHSGQQLASTRCTFSSHDRCPPASPGLGHPSHKTTKSAALEQLAASVSSNAKLPSLQLTQRRIKTLELAGKQYRIKA